MYYPRQTRIAISGQWRQAEPLVPKQANHDLLQQPLNVSANDRFKSSVNYCQDATESQAQPLLSALYAPRVTKSYFEDHEVVHQIFQKRQRAALEDEEEERERGLRKAKEDVELEAARKILLRARQEKFKKFLTTLPKYPRKPLIPDGSTYKEELERMQREKRMSSYWYAR